MKDEKKAPKLRFKGFTDDWEQCKLGDVCVITMGQSPNSNNYTDNPKDHILVQGNADMKDGQVYPRIWTTEITKTANKGDLILTVRAPVGDVGKTGYDIVIGRGVAAIQGNEFIFQLLKRMKAIGYWTKYSTGSTFESINSSEINNAVMHLPKKHEQIEVGNVLSYLDQTITLHEEKKRQLERLKSALLHKMFADKSGYPDVRFKGFNEAWTNRKLGNYFDYEQPTPYIVTNTNYSDKYNTSVLTAGQSFILGYTNEDTGVKCATYKEPVIIFDDFTTSMHLVTFPFKVKSSAMKILTLTQKNDSMYFGYTSLQNIKYKPLNHERQWISIFSKIKIGIPISKIEERKIGNLFERIDRLDNYFQQKIERLNLIKQSLLQSMFI